MTARDIRVGGGTVQAFVSRSDGPPVLLLAGGASSSRDYYPELHARLPNCRVIGVDRPGTGTTSGFVATDLSASCELLGQALRQLVDEPVVAVGHSFGCMAALELAANDPDLVRGLLLLDPTPFDDQLILRAGRAVVGATGHLAALPGAERVLVQRHNAAWRRSLGALGPDGERSFQAITGSVDLRQAAAAVSTSPRDARRLVGRLDDVHAPVLIVSADRKQTSRIHRSHRRLAQRLDAELRTWPGTVHALQLQKPAEVAAAIQELLETTRPNRQHVGPATANGEAPA